MSLPELRHLRTVRQLCQEYPSLFSEGSLRWIIFNAETNGFDACILRMGRRLFIDLRALQTWLAEHRATGLPGESRTPPRHQQRRLRPSHPRGKRPGS